MAIARRVSELANERGMSTTGLAALCAISPARLRRRVVRSPLNLTKIWAVLDVRYAAVTV